MQGSKIIYLFSWYTEKNPVRAEELKQCFYECLHSDEIDLLIIVLEHGAVLPETSSSKQKIVHQMVGRPTYSDFFEIGNKYSHAGEIVIIANTDLYPGAGTKKYLQQLQPQQAYALSRWDISKGGTKHFNRRDSQDVWIFRSPISETLKAEFCMGKPGCDNRIAQLILEAGYQVSNPSKTIRFLHLHESNIRNYTTAETIPGPYHFIHPSELI